MSYDGVYIRHGVSERLALLNKRYQMYCQGMNETGAYLTPGSAAVERSNCVKQRAILRLIDELLNQIPSDDFIVSDEAGVGYEKLCEPYERHRSKRGR
jgi:hypothetical protein